MRFAWFYLIVALWVVWRVVLPLNVSGRLKAFLTLLVAALAGFPTVVQLFFGGLISPEVPRNVLLASQISGMTLIMTFLVSLLREVLVFITVLMGRSGEKAKLVLRCDRRSALGLLAAGGALGALGVVEGIAVPRVKEYELPVANLPEGLEGLKLVQLSDLHASALLTEPHIAAIVDRVNALDPDLVLVTGDIADGTVEHRNRDVEPLSRLKARHGVFACLGNHEYYSDFEHWIKKIPALGMRLLMNEHAVLDINGAKLVLAGVTDPMAKRFGRELPDVVKAFDGAPSHEEAPRILLAHQPRPALIYELKAPFDAQLSGHTHGGQALGMDIGVALLNGDFVRGWYDLRKTKLFVHSGSGLWNGFPIRLGIPSEIALIRLVKAREDA